MLALALSVLLAQDIALSGPHDGAVRVPSSEDAWGGVRESADPLRVVDYDLEATLDAQKHTLEGKERITWRNRSDRTVSSIYLHLYLNAFQNLDSTFAQESQRFGGFRHGVEIGKGEWGWIDLLSVKQGDKDIKYTFVQPDGGPETDRTVVRFDLPQPVPPGESARIEVLFHDQLPRVIARTGYFDRYHFVAQWFPKVGVLELPGERGAKEPRWNCHEFHLFSEFYADFGDYTARITVPHGYVFGSVGKEVRVEGDTHFVEQKGVHDFAFTAWDQFQELRGGKTRVLFPEEYRKDAEVALVATNRAIEDFSKALGEYPYDLVTVVVPPFNAEESGGMEYETFFTTIGGLWPPESSANAYVTTHEFGHGYFMGILASNEFEEPFLDEGLNEFWDAKLMEDRPLKIPGLPPLGWWDIERSGSRRELADPIAGNSWDRANQRGYSSVYSRTAISFHDLGTLIGDDRLRAGFREYYRKWKFRHPSTADLEEALASQGAELVVRKFFDEHVYGLRDLDDRVEIVESKELTPEPGTQFKDGKRSELDEDGAQSLLSEKRKAWRAEHPDGKKDSGPFGWRSIVQVRRFGAHLPQTVLVTFEDGTSETLQWPAEERWHRWIFEKPSKVQSAQIDPQRAYLMDANKLDDARTRERESLPPRRWWLEVQSWLGIVTALLGAM